MSFQNVGTPRFYVDIFQYLQAIGDIESTQYGAFDAIIGNWGPIYTGDIVGVNQHPFGIDPWKERRHPYIGGYYKEKVADFYIDKKPDVFNNDILYNLDSKDLINGFNLHRYINYCAVLGHDHNTFTFGLEAKSIYTDTTAGVTSDCYWHPDPSRYKDIFGTELSEDGDFNNLRVKINKGNGFSLCTFEEWLPDVLQDNTGDYVSNTYEYPYKIGINFQQATGIPFQPSNNYHNSVSMGTYWDMPQSPNMKMTFSREFDGITSKRTKGGANLTNISYTGPPKWGELPQFTSTIKTPTHNVTRAGRRKWSLSFDFLKDDDSMGAFESPTRGPWATEYIDVNSYEWPSPVDSPGPNWNSGVDISPADTTIPMLEEANIYSRLLLPTLGGRLPFIFQPDNTNKNPDQFAICTIPTKTISFRQKSHKTYSLRFDVVETW